ncbi:MAG TPA: formylmethanofuran dehydrogenase subunit B [Planctomycetaceae bacterium]|mgnify:CR=1 FL=1|nr:formylmethanofuran dehydrogenase subunit B [Planctomycetaceae bacterium]HQZ66156.1 formylmethanofuran dehydrogenase subunit B [Planctomycetaceae bacterium]
MSTSESHVACPGCGCLCDDVSLTFDAGHLTSFEPQCALGEHWFRTHASTTQPVAELSGEAADYQAAIRHAATLLEKADYPLIYGLSRSASPGQRAAVALADQIGAVIDTTASMCHGHSIMALQEVGEVTCTLGEVRNRADLVIFWGCHPAASHPRHAERYSIFAKGRFTDRGRESRKVVMIGEADKVASWKLSPSGGEPDLIIPVERDGDFEIIAQLRALLRGGQLNNVSDDVLKLMDLMRSCRYGVFFFGLGLAGSRMWDDSEPTSSGHIHVAALLQLVAELNAVTRFTARRMRMQGDVSGADNVLLWQTGYPFAVDIARGYPRYNPGEFSANELLERRETDLCVIVGAETIPHFSVAAREHLKSIPTIVIDYPNVPLEFIPSVRFTTAVYGLHAKGTAYRMDNVPLPLRALQPSGYPTDEDVLTDLLVQFKGD